MLTNFEYMIVWVIYVVAGIFAMLVVSKMAQFLPRQLGALIKALALVLIFTPWFVNEGQGLMAPAFMVLAFDNLVIDQEDSLRALMPLVITGFVACLFLIVHHLVSRLFDKNTQ
ncbi:MAG: hypothetical protein JKY67_03805 [Pseudomonadales bacterium]|nr:hypothetical protein [Pseudomonadales bacterium]